MVMTIMMIIIVSMISNISISIIKPCLPKNANNNLNFQDGSYEVDQEFDGKGLTPYDPAHNSTYLLSGQ